MKNIPLNRSILCEIKDAYGIKSVTVIKAAVTWWLSNRAACKGCREIYEIIVEKLDKIIFRAPKPNFLSFKSEFQSAKTWLKIIFLEDAFSYKYFISNFAKWL